MPTPTIPNDNVTFTRPELLEVLPRYKIIRDCVRQLVKSRGEEYLPKPTPTDASAENTERYKAYIQRAIFYGVTGRTLKGMVGQVYARDPEITVPPLLKPVVDDATGGGISLIQLSKDASEELVGFGRAGIFVDYPKTDGPATLKQLQDGDIRPVFTIYQPENIVNWRTARRGARNVLSMVVLSEWIDVPGEFVITKQQQYRVLRLVDNNRFYTQEIWRLRATPFPSPNPNPFTTKAGPTWQMHEGPTMPLDSKGFPFMEIPFMFIGATNNDATIDEPPMYDMAELNIGHYRNSADYEEASFIAGQPTPWFSGLTQEWVEEVLKGKILLGSRSAVPLPENSQAGLLQVQSNIMPMEAMTHKESQMVALGARLVENRAVRRTLGEVQQQNASETSILASCANNVSSAFTYALVWAARFIGAPTDDIAFKLNTEFALTTMAADARNCLIAEMQAGVITFDEVRTALRRAGIVFDDNATAKSEILAWAKQMQDAGLLSSGKPAQAAKPPQSSATPPGQ